MPKPLKKPARKPKAKARKPRRPAADPNLRAHQMMAEIEAKQAQGPTTTPPHGDPFEAQFRARMAELGRKGGKASGAKRMENLSDEKRRAIARKAALARWKR